MKKELSDFCLKAKAEYHKIVKSLSITPA